LSIASPAENVNPVPCFEFQVRKFLSFILGSFSFCLMRKPQTRNSELAASAQRNCGRQGKSLRNTCWDIMNHTTETAWESTTNQGSPPQQRAAESVESRPRICLLGTDYENSNLGIRAMTTGALTAIEAQYPNASVQMLLDEYSFDILRTCTDTNAQRPEDKYAWR